MTRTKANNWKMERAGVTTAGSDRSRSNKYSGSDGGPKPAPRMRRRVWVGGYERGDGVKVAGHYRELRAV